MTDRSPFPRTPYARRGGKALAMRKRAIDTMHVLGCTTAEIATVLECSVELVRTYGRQNGLVFVQQRQRSTSAVEDTFRLCCAYLAARDYAAWRSL